MTFLKKFEFQIKQDLNLSVFDMITGINESKTLAKHVSCDCKCKFDGRRCNSVQYAITINDDVSVKKVIHVKKNIFRILLLVVVKMENI